MVATQLEVFILRHLAMVLLCSAALTACNVASAGHGPAAVTSNSEGIARGQQFAAANCAGCHAIGAAGESPHPKAPPFRTLHRHYAVEGLEEALAEGVVVGHPDMPPAQLDTQQINDLTAYLKSLS